MNPVQNRTGLASASSHDSQDVTPGGRAPAQLDSSTLLPAPADPSTTVRRWPAPAVSRSCSAGLATSVTGRAGGRNFPRANRAPRSAPDRAATSAVTTPPSRQFPLIRGLPLPVNRAQGLEGSDQGHLGQRDGSRITPGRVRTPSRPLGTLVGLTNQRIRGHSRGVSTDIRDHFP